MHAFSIWHFLIIIVWALVFLTPIWKIVTKAGYPGVAAVLAVIPVVNLVMLWVFAFAKWPVERR
ncbi:hypothetical protein BH10PSE17_BH10PSE17_13530 [soil metagenome]